MLSSCNVYFTYTLTWCLYVICSCSVQLRTLFRVLFLLCKFTYIFTWFLVDVDVLMSYVVWTYRHCYDAFLHYNALRTFSQLLLFTRLGWAWCLFLMSFFGFKKFEMKKSVLLNIIAVGFIWFFLASID